MISWPILLILFLIFVNGCSLQPQFQIERIGDLGHFEFREPDSRMGGIIIGAPRGNSEPAVVDYVRWMSARTGAGYVVAYGFGARRLTVSEPVVRSVQHPGISDDPIRRGSVFREFKNLLKRTAQGSVEIYLGVRFAGDQSSAERIEVATSGFTFEELKVLKESYIRIRDQFTADSAAPKVDVAVEPLDKISWRVSGVKHHGVLMIAEKGLNLRLPRALSSTEAKNKYREILSLWAAEAFKIVDENPLTLPRVEVRVLDFGKLESIPSRKKLKGVVIAAPHGSFDEHTAEIVYQISFRTGIAAVIAKGFTPTEAGGWRINVNRPSERRYPTGDIEIGSKRADAVYQSFKEAVSEASQGDLDLYVDIHQNARQKSIEVATLGVFKEQARLIKRAYRDIRDRALRLTPHVPAVDLLIEPLDDVEIGAWAAKAHGILGVAKKSLHFEIPLYDALATAPARDAYARILGDLINRTYHLLMKGE
jgi:hypothetical protein